MTQSMTFAELLAPHDRQRFLSETYRRAPLHVPGEETKFAEVFTWDELNELLEMSTLWSADSLELAAGGQPVPAQRFCRSAPDREGRQVLRPDMAAFREYLRQGASATVNFIDLLTPGLRAMTQTLEAVLAAQTTVTAFLSWQKVQGYGLHFDIQDVFAVQIYGTKTWRLYEGRFPNPADVPGGKYHDYPPEQMRQMAGRVQQTVEVTPGDLLYVPAGQFHEALSQSDASLHVSFGVLHLVGLDMMNVVLRELGQLKELRQPLPFPDDAQGYQGFAGQMAQYLHQLMQHPDAIEAIRSVQRERAFGRLARFQLPERAEDPLYRVVWRNAERAEAGNGLEVRAGQTRLSFEHAEAEAADWLLSRDLVAHSELAERFRDRQAAEQALGKLTQAQLVQRVH